MLLHELNSKGDGLQIKFLEHLLSKLKKKLTEGSITEKDFSIALNTGKFYRTKDSFSAPHIRIQAPLAGSMPGIWKVIDSFTEESNEDLQFLNFKLLSTGNRNTIILWVEEKK